MAFTNKQLGQAQGTTSPVSIYSPAAGTGIIRQIVVCNHETTACAYGIWLDNDGTTYTDATVHFEDVTIAGNSTVILDVYWPITSAGNLAVKASIVSTLTFTVYGAEIT